MLLAPYYGVLVLHYRIEVTYLVTIERWQFIQNEKPPHVQNPTASRVYNPVQQGELVGEMPPDRSLIEEVGLMMAGKKVEAAQ